MYLSNDEYSSFVEYVYFNNCSSYSEGPCIFLPNSFGESIISKICCVQCKTMQWGQSARIYVSKSNKLRNYFLTSSVSECGIENVSTHSISLLRGEIVMADTNSSNNNCNHYASFAVFYMSESSQIQFCFCTKNLNTKYSTINLQGIAKSQLKVYACNIINNFYCGDGVITCQNADINIESCCIFGNNATYSIKYLTGTVNVSNSYVNPKTSNSDSVFFVNDSIVDNVFQFMQNDYAAFCRIEDTYNLFNRLVILSCRIRTSYNLGFLFVMILI